MKRKIIIKIFALLISLLEFPSSTHAALSMGNTTTNNTTPSATYKEFTHNHDGTGDNHVLVCMVAINNNTGWSGWPTYNGDSPDHTLINVNVGGTISTRVLIMAWDNPPTGDNTLRINFSATESNKIVAVCQSYSDAAIGNYGTNGQAQNIHSRTLDMSTGSMAFVGGVVSSGNAVDITVDGTEYTAPFNVTNNLSTGSRKVAFHSSNAIASGGTITCVTDPNNAGAYMTNHRVEIKESVGGGGGGRRVIIIGDEPSKPEKSPKKAPEELPLPSEKMAMLLSESVAVMSEKS